MFYGELDYGVRRDNSYVASCPIKWNTRYLACCVRSVNCIQMNHAYFIMVLYVKKILYFKNSCLCGICNILFITLINVYFCKKIAVLFGRNDSSASEMKGSNATNFERENQSLSQGKQKKKKPTNGTKLESMEDDEVVSKGSIQNITTLETNCARNDQKKGKKRKRKNKGVVENSAECKFPHLEISDQCTGSKPSHNLNKSNESDSGRRSSESKNINENKKGKKSKTKNKRRSTVPTMSSDRLAAYGINEKKFKYVIQNKLHKDMKHQNM